MLNDSVWDANIPSPLSDREIAEWQEKINKVAGMYDAHTPNVRLIWGMDGNPNFQTFNRIRNRWTMPYVSKEGMGDAPDIGVARYFLQILDPFLLESPNQNAKTMQATAKETKDPDSADVVEDVFTVQRAKFKGIPYRFYMRWSLDDAPGWNGLRACCMKQAEKNQPCYGEYIPPDDRMINTIADQYFNARNYAGDEVSATKFLLAKQAMDEVAASKRQEERQQAMHEYFTTPSRIWSLPKNEPLIIPA